MERSPVDICNSALGHLGEHTISSVDPPDDSRQARLCYRFYVESVNDVLQLHEWNCAIKRASLAQEADAPAFGYSYQYQLPNDCLHVIEMSETIYPYRIEGGKLLTDAGVVSIKYVSNDVNPALFSDLLAGTIALWLAWKLAWPLTNDKEVEILMLNKFQAILSLAKGRDSLEGMERHKSSDLWVDASY